MDELLQLVQNTGKVRFPIQADTPLLSSGLIDSLQFVSLLTVLSEQFGVTIDSRDVGADNFDTVRQIHQFLQKCRGT